MLLSVGIVTAASSQVVFRYGPNMDAGYGEASVITPYVYFPPSFTSPYSGNKITQVKIGLAQDAKNVYLYINNTPKDAEHVYKQSVGALSKGWNTITLTTPYEITDADEIAIGYKASFSAANGVGYSKEHYADGDYIYNNSKTQWTSTTGSICIQAVVEGDRLPKNEMMIGWLKDVIAPYDSTSMTFTTTARNVGGNDVTNYAVKYTVDGKSAKTLAIQKSVAVNATDTFSVALPSTEVGTHHVQFIIDQVNGEADAYTPNDTVSALLTVKDPAFKRRVVCEEGTGTWCGWCPRGMVGMQLMKEAHPDQFIAISIHGNDALEIDSTTAYSYRPLLKTTAFAGFPTCIVDRRVSGDPYGDIATLYKMETSSDCHISYHVTATWNADSTVAEVKGTFMSDVDMASPNYYAAYVVLEDSVTGYIQTNYFHDNENGYMYGWEKKAEHTKDFAYNDLARGIFASFDGTPAVTSSVKAKMPVTVSYSVPIPPTVRRKDKVHIAGLIINHTTGYIENACDVTSIVTDGISAPSASGTSASVVKRGNDVLVSMNDDTSFSVAVYDITGRELAHKSFLNGTGTVSFNGNNSILIVKVTSRKGVSTYKLK